MLLSILDADITQRIVRLGSRVNESIAQYSMDTLETVQQIYSRLHRTLGSCRRELKEVEEQIRNLMKQVHNLDINNNTGEIMKYLSTYYPEHFEYLYSPLPWVSNVKAFVLDDEDGARGWYTVDQGGKVHLLDRSTYAFWRDCSDLTFIDQVTNGSFEPWKAPTENEMHAPQNAFSALKVEVVGDNYSSDEEELSDTESFIERGGKMEVEESWKVMRVVLPPASETQPPSPVQDTEDEDTEDESTIGPADVEDIDGFFDALEFECRPSVPHSDRQLEVLLEDVGDVWEMSASERQRIHTFWAERARIQLGQTYMDEFKRLRECHADKLRQCNEGKEEVRCSHLPCYSQS